MTNYKQFGDRPSVTVYVTEKDDIRRHHNEVTVNWSCCGAVDLKEAAKFLNSFRRALNYARREAKRLKA